MIRTLSLFAGIGGIDLGLERTGGFVTKAAVEIDPFCQKVLRRRFPNIDTEALLEKAVATLRYIRETSDDDHSSEKAFKVLAEIEKERGR